jgi:hypothetical protein
MQPYGHRARFELDIGEGHDTRSPAGSAATSHEAPTFVPLEVETQYLQIDIQDLASAGKRRPPRRRP